MDNRTRLLGATLVAVVLCVAASTHSAAQDADDSPVGWVESAVWRGHRGAVNAVAVSADGASVITGDSKGVVRVWNVASGKARSYRGHSSSVLDVVFDPKGRFAVSAGADKTIRVWSLDRAEELRVIQGSRGAMTCVALSTDPDIIVSGGADSILRVWDAHTGNRVRSLSVRPGRPSAIRAVFLSADGTRAFFVGGPFVSVDMYINAVDLETMQHEGWPYVTARTEAVDAALSASADRKTVVAGGLAGVVTVWAPGVAGMRLTGHAGAVLGVAVSYDGSSVASSGQDGTVRVWEDLPATRVEVLEGHRGPVNDLAFAPGGEWLVSVGDDKTVRLWTRPALTPAKVDPAPAAVGDVVAGGTVVPVAVSAAADSGVVGSSPFIADPAVERVLRRTVGQPEGPLTAETLAAVREFRAGDERIADFTGMEHCVHLELLYASGSVSDLSPLSGLARLRSLSLWDTNVSDLAPVAGMHDLEDFTVGSDGVTDLRPLASLTRLRSVVIGSRRLLDVSALSDIQTLNQVKLYVGIDVDFTALRRLGGLRRLVVSMSRPKLHAAKVPAFHASIASLQPLQHLELEHFALDVRAAGIERISFIEGLPRLTALVLADNDILDISPLSTLSELAALDIAHNDITDLQPLVDNPGFAEGDHLDVTDNPLSQEALTVQIPALIGRGVTIEGVDSAEVTPAPVGPETAVTLGPMKVHIPDPNLERALREAAGNPAGALTPKDLAAITRLHVSGRDIQDLAGMEQCTALAEFGVDNVSDLTPLADLHSLRSLHVWGANVSDLSPLASLYWLDDLRLSGSFNSLEPLSNLTELEMLVVQSEALTDLSPLRQLIGLTGVGLYVGAGADFAVLTELPHLVHVDVGIGWGAEFYTSARSLASLAFLDLDMFAVRLRGLGLADVRPLGLPANVQSLYLSHNDLADIGGLRGFPHLSHVLLRGNELSDISVLAALTELDHVDLGENRITDLSALVDNPGIGAGDNIDLTGNPLSQAALAVQIPELLRRGVRIAGVDLGSIDTGVLSPSPQPAGPPTNPQQTSSVPVTPTTHEASPSTDAVPATALIVGINAYDHHANLVNPTIDAQAVSRELREVFGVDTTTVLDATKVEFLEALHGLADREYAEDEQLLVFFSGHGYFDERIRRGYLAMRDSKPVEDDPYLQSFVSHEDVRVLLERLDCNHVLLVVDSCFSGTLDPMVAMASGARPLVDASGLIPKTEYIERKLRYRTRRYITAGGKEYVPDGRPGQHSPFARQFLAALRTFGGADGILTLEEILLHLERVDPEPRTGELYGNEPGSSFVLVAGPVVEDAAPRFSALVVTVSPPDAKVRIVGGPPAAESLLKTLRVEPTGTAVRRYHLPLGAYRVRVTRDGYATTERDVTLTGAPAAIDVTLTRP